MSLKDEIRKVFPYLFNDFGFVFIEESDPDIVAIAQSGYFRLRFIKDRTDFFLDAGMSSAPDQWVGLYEILDELKRNGRISFEYKYANTMKRVSELLRNNFLVVKEYILTRNEPNQSGR